MHHLTVTDILLSHQHPLVVTASDETGRLFVGLSYGVDEGLDEDQHFAFAEVSAETLSALAEGEVDLLSALTERVLDTLVLGRGYGDPCEVIVCKRCPMLPLEALPLSGMFLGSKRLVA